MTKQALPFLVDRLKALAHPVRLRILALLGEGELCVCAITEVIGLAPSTVSQHLSDLRRAGLVTERKEGRWVHYALREEVFATALLVLLRDELAGDSTLAADRAVVRGARNRALPAACASKGARHV